MSGLDIRPATAEAFAVAVEWAAAEGWNPGLDDLDVFHAADPAGFLIGYRDGAPVASISVVRYGATYGFLGFYIVVPEQRGTGAGLAIWEAGLARLAGRTVGLDGVVAQQDNYRKSGFVLAERNIRHSGVPRAIAAGETDIRAVTASDLPALLAYDRRFFAAPRDGFARAWALPPAPVRRRALLAEVDGGIAGYAVIRACRAGYKVGPLFADGETVATDLLAALAAGIEEGAEISLDTPEDNPDALRLAERFGLEPVFETARMYRGPAPDLPIHSTYGITTFELG